MAINTRFPAPAPSKFDDGPAPHWSVALVLRVALGLLIVVATTRFADHVPLLLWWILISVAGWLTFAPAMDWWQRRRQLG